MANHPHCSPEPDRLLSETDTLLPSVEASQSNSTSKTRPHVNAIPSPKPSRWRTSTTKTWRWKPAMAHLSRQRRQIVQSSVPQVQVHRPAVHRQNPSPPRKRKNDAPGQPIKHAGKRRRLMGRPRNEWTPTRLRKLVRLYLMTNLDIVEISKVLQDKGFQPCKRDIQKQLNLLLQSRPDQIRLKGHTTKTRLAVLRECKNLRKTRRTRSYNHQRELRLEESVQEFKQKEPECAPESDDFISTPLDSIDPADWSWLDLGLGDPYNGAFAGMESEKLQNSSDCDSRLLAGTSVVGSSHDVFGVALPTSPPKYPHAADTPITSYSIPGPNWPLTGSQQSLGEISLDVGTDTNLSREKSLLRVDLDLWVELNYNLNPGVSSPSQHPQHRDSQLDRISIAPVPKRLSRVSSMGISSLKRRLSAGYTDSYLGEIKSLMEHLSISNISSISASRTGTSRQSKYSISSFTTQSDLTPPIPAGEELEVIRDLIDKEAHPQILPGAFPRFCWGHLSANRLRRCDHGPETLKRQPLCQPAGPVSFRSMRGDVLSRIINYTVKRVDIHETDTFGNSVLHIATELGAKPSYLLSLIKMDANINAVNNAGQTFLHLFKLGHRKFEDIRPLLTHIYFNGFKFDQHDHYGQTAVHSLVRPCSHNHHYKGFSRISPSCKHGDIKEQIIKHLTSLTVDIPTSRDNLGYTVVGCLKSLVATPPSLHELYHDCLTAGGQTSVPKASHEDLFLHNYEKDNKIQTMEDLQQYEIHADLLRTILKAKSDPLIEDSSGRNALHCLAEVSFDLPIPGTAPSTTTQATESPTKQSDALYSPHEQHLVDILAASVNPNNHDRKGMTPLMAFIIHDRPREDEASTIRILNRLIEAGADVNRRNRKGETALHIAIKLGRKAATKVLLEKHANVHARDNRSVGVVALGYKSTEKLAHDGSLYAQILLCITLAINAGAGSKPTILDEWGLPQWRIRA
ncbi:hypothetical protein B7494_g292 [Chlorociboria aeruginascens]|nr:hypothetical protein B7494_g292 [Chlorociboria aeruginascens]